VLQVAIKVIADAMLSVFDEEDDSSSLYWIFSGFVKMRQTLLLPHLDKMVRPLSNNGNLMFV